MVIRSFVACADKSS